MIVDRSFKPFFFGERMIEVSHPIGTEENYAAILVQNRSIHNYEPSLSYLINENVSKGDLFLDIGAQIGLFSIHAALLGADVVSFEMRPSIAHCHFETKARNGITNWLPLPYAVGESLSQLPISDDAQFALVGKDIPGLKPETTVTCTDVDSLGLHTNYRGRSTFVKMDIEGFEVFALRGMRLFMQVLRPVMAIECHPHAAWSYGAVIAEIPSLLPHGYRLQVCTTHRDENEKGALEDIVGALPDLPNYMVVASPKENTVRF